MAALLPEPNNGNYALNGPSNDYFASGSYSNHRNIFDMKTNYNPTSSTTLFARYSYAITDLFDPQALGPAGGPAIDAGQPGTLPPCCRAWPSARRTPSRPRCWSTETSGSSASTWERKTSISTRTMD